MDNTNIIRKPVQYKVSSEIIYYDFYLRNMVLEEKQHT